MNKFLLLFFLITCQIFSYYYISAQVKAGRVEIVKDNKVDELLGKHKILSEKINGVPGYRIQIFSESGTNSKTKANNVKTEFLKSFSYINVYIIFQEPNYKVRVGDFRTQLDALGFLKKVLPEFPNAFIVADKINFMKIN
jgi:hypothetical protein